MTREAFRRAADLYHRKAILAYLPAIIAFVVCIAFAPFHERLKDAFGERLSTVSAETIAVLPVAVLATLGLALVIPMSRRIERRYGAPCPHCGKALADFR